MNNTERKRFNKDTKFHFGAKRLKVPTFLLRYDRHSRNVNATINERHLRTLSKFDLPSCPMNKEVASGLLLLFNLWRL